MSVRRAKLGDLPELVKMAKAMHGETVYRHLPLSETKVAAFFAVAMADRSQCVIVHERKGQLDGLIVGQVAAHFFSDHRGCWDRLFFVSPGARGSRAAYRLVKALEAFARSLGAVDLWPGISSGNRAGERLFEGLGFERVGAVFKRTV